MSERTHTQILTCCAIVCPLGVLQINCPLISIRRNDISPSLKIANNTTHGTTTTAIIVESLIYCEKNIYTDTVSHSPFVSIAHFQSDLMRPFFINTSSAPKYTYRIRCFYITILFVMKPDNRAIKKKEIPNKQILSTISLRLLFFSIHPALHNNNTFTVVVFSFLCAQT